MSLPSHKWRLAGIVVLVTALGGVLFLAANSREPRHAGRTLSAWLDDLAPMHGDAYKRGDPESEQAQALRAIGTNAIPWLLSEMRAKGSPIEARINWLLAKQSLIKFRFPDINYRLRRATIGFQLLGALAEPAIPDLLSMVDSTPGYVPGALAYIGSPAVPALRQCLTNTRTFSSGQIIIPGNTIVAIYNAANLGHLTESDVAILMPTVRYWAQSTNEHASRYAASLLKEHDVR